MKKTNNELSAEQIAILNNAYPVSESNSRPSFPRLGILSKDLTETVGTGKNKTIKVIESAGTFFTEKDLGEVDEEGKKKWTREYVGDSIDVIITFHRKQLRMYDSSLEKFYSTPIYDSKDQIIPLYLDKKVVKTGTPEELQKFFPTTTDKGKLSSKLKEEIILFVIFNGELYQCNLPQSGKWSFMDYKKGLNPSTVTTELNSVEETFGSNTYRKFTFKSKGLISGDQFELVQDAQSKLTTQVSSDAEYFLKQAESRLLSEAQDKDMEDMAIKALEK